MVVGWDEFPVWSYTRNGSHLNWFGDGSEVVMRG